jgi:hypothetical protein
MSSHSLHHLNWVLPVRIVQAVFAIIILGLTAYGKRLLSRYFVY